MAIAADALVTFGDTRLAHGYEANDKVFRIGDSWIGMAGTTAHFPVLRRALGALPNKSSSSARATRCSRPSSSCTPS